MSKLQLVDCETKKPLAIPSKVRTFRGEEVTLTDAQPPQAPGSTGRVYCTDDKGRKNSWFPSVINAEWKPVE